VLLHETEKPSTWVFDLEHQFEDFYIHYIDYDSQVKIGTAPGVTCFFVDQGIGMDKYFASIFSIKHCLIKVIRSRNFTGIMVSMCSCATWGFACYHFLLSIL
jgi:hypothetical protein